MKKENDIYLDFAKKIAKRSAKIMLKYFKKDNGADYKFDNTIVTKADTQINDFLIEQVKKTFPTHCVDGEEKLFGKSDYVWVCDPVDGTAMYARHIPVAVFSLALVVKGNPIVGVICDPFTKNVYYAQSGSGAFRNGHPIHVNDVGFEGMKSVAMLDDWAQAEYDMHEAYHQLRKKTYAVMLGSGTRASACVANGDFTFVVFPGTKHKNCDVAAAKVIVEEAGGKVTDLFGNQQRYDKSINGAIISNGKVHDEVVKIINRHLKNLKK